jgi:hypothetical protein
MCTVYRTYTGCHRLVIFAYIGFNSDNKPTRKSNIRPTPSFTRNILICSSTNKMADNSVNLLNDWLITRPIDVEMIAR